jgi:GDSL-like lipase/acylhydrolase family protein
VKKYLEGLKHMSQKYRCCLGFAACLLAMACADDSSSGTPPASAATASPAGGGNDMGGTGMRTPEQIATADTTAPGESPTAGLGGVSLDESAASGGTSVPQGADTAPDASAAPVGSVPSAFPSDVSRPRIMIVGDSISAGPGCYKKFLLAELNANGYSNFDFVGEYSDDCGGGVMHSARSCTTALDYIQPTFMLRADCGGGTFPGLAALMVEHTPDLLMLQLGVNDVWGGQTTAAILASYSTLLEQARAENPNIAVAVAQIQQIRPTGADGDAVFARAQQLVEAVPAWASTVSQESSPVYVADLWANSDTAQTLDGVHPDDAGAQRMGQNWFEALKNVLTPD